MNEVRPDTTQRLPPTLEADTPPSALAPMQNVTDHPFLHVIAAIGAPDYFFTEYFSVHESYKLDPATLKSIVDNQTGRPVYAQVLGNNADLLAQAAAELTHYPVAGVDLNLGCPAPKIYKRNAGGGLLRDPALVDTIIARMRDAVPGSFSVKCRLGFETPDSFEACVESVRRHGVDFLTVHGRTVKQMYRGAVDYERIALAAAHAGCPVFANGNLTSAPVSLRVLEEAGCHGAMIGRAAIRNPWIFRQIRELARERPVFQPTLGDVYDYIEKLYHAKNNPDIPEKLRIAHLKRYLVFIGEGVDPDGRFLYDIRRIRTTEDLFHTCRQHLLEEGKAEQPFADEPFANVTARPNCEA